MARRDLHRLPDKRSKLLLSYRYCSTHDRFAVLVSDSEKTVAGTMEIEEDVAYFSEIFSELESEYSNLILQASKRAEEKKNGGVQPTEEADIEWGNRFRELHENLTNFFISPIYRFIQSNAHLIISANIEIGGVVSRFDLSLLFDLRYRFLINDPGEDYLITMASQPMQKAVTSMIGMNFPTCNSIIMLYGFNKFEDNYNDIWAIMNQGLDSFRTQGGEVRPFLDGEQLLDLMGREYAGKLIQIYAHHSANRLSTLGGEVRTSNILDRARILYNAGKVREDCVIDAQCCSSFNSFPDFYSAGVRLVYANLDDISLSDLANYATRELYAGYYARQTHNFHFPYLDGKSYLHEARARARRCAYQAMGLGII